MCNACLIIYSCNLHNISNKFIIIIIINSGQANNVAWKSFFPLNLEGVTVPVEDVHHRGNWAKEFWTSSSIDEIQV